MAKMSLPSREKSKKVLIIDLKENSTEVRAFPDLYKYIGGMALGLKLYSLYQDEDPVVLSVGPLNGFYPFASKTSIVLQTGGVAEDLYIGGSLSYRIKFCGVDSIVIKRGALEPTFLDINDTNVDFMVKNADLNLLGLPGKRSIFAFSDMSQILSKLTLDGCFVTPENYLENKFLAKNLLGLVISGHTNFDIYNKPKYEEIYKKLLDSTDKLEVTKELYPSCSGCPMGCSKSRVGELGGNILVHSLCACTYAQQIYSDVGTVFSCLHTLGYDYSHEDIENLPNLVNAVLKEIS
jgi:aldehyde:ferredoxin oxidoreductase